MSNGMWIGVDLGKYEFDAALVGPQADAAEWPTFPCATFQHSEQGLDMFVTWVAELGVTAGSVDGICVESTGRLAWRWYAQLADRVAPVSIVNPARPAAFATTLGLRDKTDRIAACVLALYGRTIRPRPTTISSKVHRELREFNQLYDRWQKELMANKSRLQDGPDSATVRQALRAHIRSLKREMERLEHSMSELIQSDEQLCKDAQQATTVIGIGEKAARTILAQFGDLRAYTRNELVALAGLYPKQYQSGSSVYRRPRLAKGGGRQVRKVLYMCALSARHHNPHLRAYGDRLEARGKVPMAIIGAVMRKLLVLTRAVIVSGVPYDPNYGVSE